MNEQQFEECSLSEASHVEVNGKVYLLGGNEVFLDSCHGERIGLGWVKEDAFIPEELFPVLGIKTFKEIKPEPIEFIGYTQYFTNCISHIMNVPEGVPAGTKFKCVQIVEED